MVPLNIFHDKCYLLLRLFFAKRGDSTVVVDKEGNVVATLDINTKVRILNNKLYQVRGNQYIVVDLNQLEK